MSKILGLDISSISTGCSVLNKGRLIKSSLGIIAPNPKSPYGERLQVFEREVKKIIRKHKPEYVIIEDIFKSRNIKTFKSLSMFRGVAIKAIYDETGRDPISVMASEARKIIGVENKKERAFEYVINKFKLDFDFDKHNDIADAIVLVQACHQIIKKGIDVKSIRSSGRKRKSKRKRNKKRV